MKFYFLIAFFALAVVILDVSTSPAYSKDTPRSTCSPCGLCPN